VVRHPGGAGARPVHAFDGRIVTDMSWPRCRRRCRHLRTTSCRWSSTMSATSSPARFPGSWPRRGAAAAERYVRLESLSRLAAAGLTLSIALGLGASSGCGFARAAGPQQGRADRQGRPDRLFDHRDLHHCRHRHLGAVRVHPASSRRAGHRVPVRLQWSPQLAIRADQVGSSGAFGAVPLFTGTLLIAASRWRWRCRSACSPPSTSLNTPPPGASRGSSRCSRCSPASRRSSTASLPRWSSGRCSARRARRPD